MATIKIKNVGPIEEADLTLNRINVFMGPQSSGKSTIAKIISYCTWVEKDVATSQSLDKFKKEYFKEHLEKYHKLKEYFKPSSYILYDSNIIKIKYEDENFSIEWKDRYAYKRSKISYIPSERNMVTLPEVKKVEFGDTNIRSFLFDWSDARKHYSKNEELSVLNLGVKYYYNENADEDHIVKYQNGGSYDILLSNASSGLQSITPLISMVDYLTNRIYKQEELISLELNTRKNLVQQMLLKEFALEKANDIMKALFSNQNSQLIIEEPEQNLFPETQRDLVYYLLEKCLDREREHRLTITTHSPYILYALNNCMLGELVKSKINNASEKEKIKCENALVNPKYVSIYEIHNGILKRIQQDDGLISKNYFDEKMKELMDDFYKMLNYYG
jgi:predicted ATPase